MMNKGVPGKVVKISNDSAERVVRSASFPISAQSTNSSLTSGKVSAINGNQVTVRLANGEQVSAELTGSNYANVGSQVNVLGNQVV